MKTFAIKTKEDSKKGGNFIQITDEETGVEISAQKAQVNIEKESLVTLTLTGDVSGIDLVGILPDFIPWLKEAISCYEQYNENRTDGLILHTGCLKELIKFLEALS